MPEYVSNSHKSKREKEANEEKKIDRVVSGPVSPRKKSEFRKMADVFISEDATNVKSYIFMDVIVPAIRNLIEDIIVDSTHMIFRGERGGRDRRKNEKTPYYRSYERERDRDRSSYRESRTYSGYDYENYVIPSRDEANEVLCRMDDLMSAYKTVSVADFYELVGVRCNYTDNKYGWSNLRNARVVPVRDGYVIELPKAMPLD